MRYSIGIWFYDSFRGAAGHIQRRSSTFHANRGGGRSSGNHFCTGVYAENNPDWVKSLHSMHELASHGYFHGHFDASKDLPNSRKLLEKLSNKPVKGFRMARMQYVEEAEILKAGYTYHSSLNPTWIPGRYDHRDKPTKPFFEKGLWNVPASVSPWLRIPLFG